jgi:ABC-type glycerol-3-phosphate transport system permease component
MSRERLGEPEVVSHSAGQGGWLAVPRHAVLLFATFLVLAPLAFAILTSLKTLNNYGLDKLGLPDPVFWGNFPTALRGGRFFLWFLNSAILSFGSVFLSTAVAALGAYAFARMEFPGRGALLAVISSLMIIPPVVMLIPLFILLTRTGLNNTYWGAILVYAGLVTPFSVYMLTNFFKTIPFEIIESAVMDGASSFDILRKILLPLSAPALITMIVVNTLWVWNDLLVALVFLGPQQDVAPATVALNQLVGNRGEQWHILTAGAFVTMIVPLLVFLALQRYFVRGILSGSVKG